MADRLALRATGWSRFPDAIFLLIWLGVWLVGELLAIALVVWMIASALSAALGRPPVMAAWAAPTDGSVSLFLFFLLIWLTLWTAGGIAAGTTFLRRLAGEDEIEVSARAIMLSWRAGPIRRRREMPRSSLRRVRIAPKDQAVVADTDSGSVTVSDLGTLEERRELLAWLSSRLALPDDDRVTQRERELRPEGRDVEITGTECLVTHPTRRARTIRMWVMLIVAVLMTLGWIDLLRRGFANPTTGEMIAVLVTGFVAAAGVWFVLSRTEWSVRPGRMSVRRRLAHWTLREQDFQASSTIAIEHQQDSDGDDRYTLVIRDSARRRVLETALHDHHELLALGDWLSSRTGLPFAGRMR